MTKKKYRALALGLALSLTSSFAVCQADEAEDIGQDTPAMTANNEQLPPEAPPDNAGGTPPEGTPPAGSPDRMQQTAANAADLQAARIFDGTTETSSNETITSENTDENTVLLRNGAHVTMNQAILTKSGDTSNGDNSNFNGLNAVLLANNSTAILSHLVIASDAEGANAIFATGSDSHIQIAHTKIHTTHNSSRGLDATYNGNIHAAYMDITTEGAHCAALATDRGEGSVSVSNSILATSGDGSPCIYSTGSITAADSKGVATGSEMAVVEGKNSISLLRTELVGNKKHGIMLYQSFSGDANSGTARFAAKDSKLTNLSDGPMFYITNTQAEASLENTELNNPENNILIQVTSDHWGKTGSNGGDFTLRTTKQKLNGDVLANNISSIAMNLGTGTDWTGSFNKDKAAKQSSIRLAAKATWTLTADSYATSFEDDDLTLANIHSQGHNIYYNPSKSSKKLKGRTYSLEGGGQLIPSKFNRQ